MSTYVISKTIYPDPYYLEVANLIILVKWIREREMEGLKLVSLP